MTTKRKRGRPRIEIDWRTIAKLCRFNPTQKDVADMLEVSVDTLERACRRDHGMIFADFLEQKVNVMCRMPLKQKQMQLALRGDRGMLIWLGKQYLGQRDKFDVQSDELNAKIESLVAALSGTADAAVPAAPETAQEDTVH